MSSQTLHIGVLLLPSYVLLDAVGPTEYINSHTQEALKGGGGIPEEIIAKGATIVWHYISSDLNPVQPSIGSPQIPTATYRDYPELHYLIVAGGDPTAILPEGCAAFLQGLIVKDTFKGLLTVCTGSILVAQSGILDGFSVCSDKYALRTLALAGTLDKKVKWIGDKRWNVDGKVWSSAGITAGLDLAAEFARVHFDPVVVELVKDLAEYQPSPAQPDPFARILDGVNLF